MAAVTGIRKLGAQFLRRWLAHPLTAGMRIDDPATTELRRQIIELKPFLKSIYDEWYRMLAAELPAVEGAVLELGAGAGSCNDAIPGVIRSEVFYSKRVELVADAQQLPLGDGTLRAIVFTDVLHHMPDVRQFFAEAVRSLRPGGKILMIEPWVTRWSTFIYKKFHHEPFLPEAKEWRFLSSGPLSGANGALPWILFVRDRTEFEKEFGELRIERIRPFLPFRDLVSGGVGLRSLMPNISYRVWAGLEKLLEPQMERLGMFAFISLLRR